MQARVVLMLLLCGAVPPAQSWAAPPAFLIQSEPDTPPDTMEFIWQTVPGVRYELWLSDDLVGWTEAPGFPRPAPGLADSFSFDQADRKFFKVIPIDEQPPEVVGQFPAVDGFAVGRFADLVVQLEDASGIAPASIQLTVGTLGTFGQGSPGFSFDGQTITFDSGSDTALGAYGETVTVSLAVADTAGNTLNRAWAFRLELEPQAPENIFVFGSPTAQRAGQRVSGPAATLASRFPAGGPMKANDPPSWAIESVVADRIVIAYDAGGAPSFQVGQLICNLVPTAVDEIFYRRVLAVSDDPGARRLTLMTEDANLTEFLEQGSASLSSESVVFEVAPDGTLVRALSVAGDLTFPRIGYDLSGTSLALREDGYEFTLAGAATVSVGDDQKFLEVTADEWSWWLTPRLRVGLETQGLAVKSFEAIASGQVSSVLAAEVSVLLLGAKTETTLFDLPEASEPKHPVLIAVVPIPVPPFGIPVYGVLGFDFRIKAEAEAGFLLETEFAWRQEFNVNFGLAYTDTGGLDWVRSFQATARDIEPPSLNLTGEFGLKLVLEPTLEFLVYGLAGMDVSLEPAGGIKTWAKTDGTYGGQLEADLDFVIGTAGVLPEAELSLNVWHGEWPLTAQELVFKTHPQSVVAAPGEDVSFTCSVDSPSPATFQWFHKGVKIPGQTSRSLFLPRVNSNHAGSYFVRATAPQDWPLPDLVEDSDTATLTVQAPTPENQDTDGDGIADIHETGTGVWVSATDTGTNPLKADTDGDGLKDGAETNTRNYVSPAETGTDPHRADTDADGVSDKTEIDRGTDPNAAPAPSGMALIPAGSFSMGDALSASGDGSSDELPVHTVNVSAFYMEKYEVTKALWDEVANWAAANGYDINAGSASGKASNHPAYYVTWYECVKWCNARSQKGGLTPCYTVGGATYKTGSSNSVVCNFSAGGYRLPTEAEWEKAARGGASGRRFPWGDTIDRGRANYNVYSSNGTTNDYFYDLGSPIGYDPTYNDGTTPYTSPVGSFAPNGYGLRDMAGNLWEWCWDWYSSSYYSSSPGSDPSGSPSGSGRVLRGGGWSGPAFGCRVANRLLGSPGFSPLFPGFRCVRR